MTSTTFTGDLKNSRLDLWVLSGIALLLPFGFFAFAWWFYSSPEFLDLRYRTLFGEDTIWLCLLLGLPLLIQGITVVSLLRLTRRDRTVTQFYRLCLVTMTVGSSGYCFLWLLYTKGWENQRFLSIVALVLIVLLVVVVGFVTYLIMWSPKPLPQTRLTVADVNSNKGTLCSRLHSAQEANLPAYLVNMFNSLGEDVKKSIAEGAKTGNFETVNVPAMVKCLNDKVIENQDFFSPQDVEDITDASQDTRRAWYDVRDSQTKLTKAERKSRSKAANRLLLEGCFGNCVISHFAGTLTPGWLSVQLRRLKDGLTQAPFESLIFFFTVFLATSYLFAFSFAFADKAYLERYGQPALFMARNRASGAVIEPTQIDGKRVGSIRNDAIENTPWPPYWLYVISDGSGFVSDSRSFNTDAFDSLLERRIQLKNANKHTRERIKTLEKQLGPTSFKSEIDQDHKDASTEQKQKKDSLAENERTLADTEADLKREMEAWKTTRNHDHIRRLVRAIEDEAAHKRAIMLDLIDVSKIPINHGRAHGGTRTSRPVPAASEDFVKRNINYLLTKKLVENSANMNNVEWLDGPAPLRSGLTQADIANTNESWETQLTKKPLSELKDRLFVTEVSRIYRIKDQFSPTENRILNDLFAEIAQLVQKGELKEEQQLYEHKLDDSLTMLQEVRQAGELKGLEGWTNQIVAVSVKSVSDKHSFIPLSLMDYMYFTIYTITTTGYGDIVPTTTYAKFLCSFANILEVFFLVVFFNALLSAVKRDQSRT